MSEDKPYSLELCYYYGRSCVSRVIEFLTWGEISHVAIRDPQQGCVWEAWQRGGVSKVPDISTNHTDSTRVDVFALDLTKEQYDKAVAFLDAQVGKPYDFKGVLSFVFRHPVGSDGAWFCSEVAQRVTQEISVVLQRCPSYKASPTILFYSPVQRFVRTEYTSTRRAS